MFRHEIMRGVEEILFYQKILNLVAFASMKEKIRAKLVKEQVKSILFRGKTAVILALRSNEL